MAVAFETNAHPQVINPVLGALVGRETSKKYLDLRRDIKYLDRDNDRYNQSVIKFRKKHKGMYGEEELNA